MKRYLFPLLMLLTWHPLLALAQSCDLPMSWTSASPACTDGTANCQVTGWAIWSAQNPAGAPPVSSLSGAPTATVGPTVLSYDFANTPCGTSWSLAVAALATVNGIAVTGPQTNIATGTSGTTGTGGTRLPAPPGAISVQPPNIMLKTTGTAVFIATQVPDGWAFTGVGSVPVGSPCISSQGVNQYNVVSQQGITVTWLTAVHPLAIMGLCQ